MIHDTVLLPRGPAGAGKSTFASAVAQRNGLANTAVVSSDAWRLMLCDDISSVAADEWATLQPQTFQLFLTIVGMRLSIGRPAIADGVNLYSELRSGLLGHARAHGYRSVLVVFNLSLETCLSKMRNAPRDAAFQKSRFARNASFLTTSCRASPKKAGIRSSC